MAAAPDTRPLDVLCAGQLFTDVVMAGLPESGPRLGEELHVAGHAIGPGGIANAALHAARLGARVGVAADAGSDVLSAAGLRVLRDAGVDLAATRTHDGWATPLTVALTWAGDRAQVTSAAPVPGPSALTLPTLPPAVVTLAHVDDRPMPWIADAVARGGEVWADVGWDETGAWDLGALPSLPACTGFTPNLAEALAYTRTQNVDTALDTLAEIVPLVVVTMGADGVAALDARTGVRVRLPAVPVTLRNANGAGDSYAAGLAVAHARAAARGGAALADRLRFAGVVAACHVAGTGGPATGPTLADVAMLADTLGPDHAAVVELTRGE